MSVDGPRTVIEIEADYTIFTGAIITADTITNNVRLPGQYYDSETGLAYNYYRTYDPATGRYVESDPIGLGGGLNTYAYVDGNPLTYSDKRGLCGVGDCLVPLVGAGAVGAIMTGYTTYKETGSIKAGLEAAPDGALGGVSAAVTYLAGPETFVGKLIASGLDLAFSAAGDLKAAGNIIDPGKKSSVGCNR